MLPWVLLYGVTAFLFNHPSVFSDAPTVEFGATALVGTPMECPPTPVELAGQVVVALQARAPAGMSYALIEPEAAKYNHDAAFATVKADGREVSLLIDATGKGGTVRSRPAATAETGGVAPFAIGGRPAGGKTRSPNRERGGDSGKGQATARATDGLKLDYTLHERVLQSIPAMLERTGFPNGDVTVTSVPDLVFLMDADGKRCRVTYNAQTGAVGGRPADDTAVEPTLSPRRFLTRMHLQHGYPGEVSVRWVWAVVVDIMAGVMVFWWLSGVLMWWQIKATRWLGFAVLVVSATTAVAVGFGMHEFLSAAGR